jgi:peptidoglycan/xylan/chitin deacetylase (PgdA/CDA1 family)
VVPSAAVGRVAPLVLCYHAVSSTWEHRLAIDPELLLGQVRVLSRVRRLRITFDDAYRSASNVIPELQRLGSPVTVFVCTALARRGSPLTIPELAGDDTGELATMDWDELRALNRSGVDIGSHGVSHPRLPELTDAELRDELVDSKAEIESELGGSCTELAYPYGEHDARVRAAARAAGYTRAFGLWRSADDDPYAARRLDLYRRHTPFRAVLMTTPLHRFAA